MIKDLIKWVAPGLAMALATTAICLTSAAANDGAQRLDPAPLILAQLQSGGSIVTLDAPRVADYWVSATLQPGGTIVFDGYAPDDATRQALRQFQGADISWLKLGSGAPGNYRPAVDFGLSVLARMSAGRFALRQNVITISGIARSSADYQALRNTVSAGAPQGLVLAQAEITAPVATNFAWTAVKSADGAVMLSGSVPTPDDEAALLARAGANARTGMTYASGAPNGFSGSAQTGLALLQRLSEGKIELQGSAWTLTGTARSPEDKGAIEAEFTNKQLAAAGWSMAIAAPAATVATAAPVVTPTAPETPPEPAAETPAPDPEQNPVTTDPAYTFSATRTEGQTVLSGQVPSDADLQALATQTGGSIDALSVAPGAPDDFVANAQLGLQQLTRLTDGRLNYSADAWALSGTAPDSVTAEAIKAAIAAAANPAEWTATIAIPEPVAVPAVAAPVTPSTGTADVAACVAPLADFSARNAILYQSGAAIITAESEPALDELAADLSACPDAVVHIEGHTDADGDEASNLALSVARAEAVIAALITRGVNPDRLYAVGYGEASPIADNETPAGKRLNRRIVVTVLPEHY
ncbi:OmpA family protein [Devosia neptuniae]|uniref:OmpA family protein n=1 Tax=Devosia neptuniae TaxID=191302 RepID=A0ABY6CIE9_9HYPH|nr:OmpA family protein [Devosia neptuniae]UXN69823.1 OmpA family protein [Devosia neptuniae]